MTAHASPGEVIKGEKVTVTGSARRGLAGELVSLKTVLEFRPDAGGYRKIKSVTSNEGGILKTKVTARRSGTFRFRYVGNPTTEPGTSNGDHVSVTAKPKAYKS